MRTIDESDIDRGLIREFVLERSELAFAALARRHMNLVFGVAMRAVGNRADAEEIAQNVFIELARKAAWLQNRDSLASWLHRAALLEALQWRRAGTRRKAREDAAIDLETTMKTEDEDIHACAHLLDEALLRLREGERQAVLLRYFEGLNNREVGRTLGIGEDAARKRVDKALETIAEFFRKRGFSTVSASSVLAFGAHEASAGLAATIVQAAMTSPTGAAGGFCAKFLARFLGLDRGHLAWMCATFLLLPAIWQQARLNSMDAERSRLAALLESIQSQQAVLARRHSEMASASGRLDGATPIMKNGNGGATNSNASPHLDPRLFYWDEKSDAVRMPKESLKLLEFDGKNNSWSLASYPADIERVIDKTGRLSSAVLVSLGLSDEEQGRLQSYFTDSVRNYRQFADAQAVVGSLDLLPSTPPDFVVTNADTRVWTIPNLEANAVDWKKRFLSGIDALIGGEREQMLMQLAFRDGSLSRVFEDFGKTSPTIVVTPIDGTMCKLARSTPHYGHPRWFGDYRAPIEDIAYPGAAGNRNLAEDFLGGAVPSALSDYFRVWLQSRSNTSTVTPK